MKLLYIYITIFLLFTSCNREKTDEPVNDGIPPNAPIGARSYLNSDGEIGFEWPANQQAGIKGYNVYKFVNDTVRQVASEYTTKNYYEEYYLEYDSTYYYRISAVDVFGLISKPSEFISFQPINRYKPYAPSQLMANGKNWFDNISFELRWHPAYDTDIKGYEIHRDTIAAFSVSDSSLIGFSTNNSFKDSSGLKILTDYYYKIISVDKGNLKSKVSFESNDIILNRPELIFPSNSESLDYFSTFEIKTAARPATYKLFIQANELFDVIYEKEFSNSQISSNIIISVGGLTLEAYKKYFWRVAAYTKDLTEVNSFSNVRSFTIIP